MQGFKSFADQTSMLFDDGVTAIVGPNGCGKSNVSDAVRWVLGEQRARILRGAKMEEVIFQGSSAGRAVNVSEVSLVFATDEGILPTPFREVVVTRRLSRSGDSEYLLNGAPCRLRDIHDLMRGTGLGAAGRPARRGTEPGSLTLAPAQARRAPLGTHGASLCRGPHAGVARHGV